MDGRRLADSRRRGIATYLRILLAQMARHFPDDEYAVLVPGRDPLSAREALSAPNIRLWRTRLGSRALHGAAGLLGRPEADRLLGGCDVMWLPAVAPVAVSAAAPVVLTVHDLSFEHRPGDFTPYERAWHRIARPRRLAEQSERVIAVSEATRRDVIAGWRLEPKSVVTVPSGPGRPAAAPGPAPAGLPRAPFVLAVGALEPRKRPDLLLEAHRRATAHGLTAGLVFAGDGPLRAEVEAGGALVLGHLPDAQLEAVYAGAQALACPSREEGFGFTPLEAVARGVPAVVADLPALRETLGEAALRVPPGDPAALSEALLRLEREDELRQRLVAAGREPLERLSWERAARGTRAVLADAASSAGP